VALLWAAGMVAIIGCGSVQSSKIDAAAIDAPVADAAATDAQGIDAPATDAAATDAQGIDAQLPIDAPACSLYLIQQCDTQGTIAEFCPTGMHVNRLQRCDGSFYMPDATYLMYHLCNCTFQTCGCSGVAWQAVECCAN